MSKKYLIKFKSDYADEFDVEGFWVDEADSVEEIEERALSSFESGYVDEDEDEDSGYPIERYFGTNEALTFDSSQDYLESLTIEEISEEEYGVILDLFGGSFGTYF